MIQSCGSKAHWSFSAFSLIADTRGWSAQARGATVSPGATGAMVGPRRTGGDEAEAARGNLCGSKRASAGAGGVWRTAQRRASWMPFVSRSEQGEEGV